MKKSLLFISAVSLLLAGCAKEQFVKEQRNDGAVTVVKATFEQLSNGATKAAVTDPGVFTWQNGDKAAFTESSSSTSYCFGTNNVAGATAQFAFDGSPTFTNSSLAIYPDDLTTDQVPTNLKVKVPDSRVWVNKQTNVAMYGKYETASSSFSFSHMGGLVKVRVNNVPTNAREFVFKAVGCKINGEFTVETESTYKVIKTATSNTESEQTYTLTWADAPAAENTMDFYIPLPVGTYSGGFAFYLQDEEHNVLDSKVGSTPQTITRQDLLLMPEITFTGGVIEGEYILPKSKNVILKIDAAGSNDITLKYDGESHLPTNLEIQVIGGTFDKKVSGNLPFTHLDYTQGNIANVEITTSASTFNIVHPAKISEKLIVKGGNVVLKGATVKAIEVAEGATADGENPVRIKMEKFTPEGGTEKTPAVTDKIVANADVVVASEGVSVTVEGGANIKTEVIGKGSPLPGVFSVSTDKKVQFSPGNLYAKKVDNTNWNLTFYDEQYACNSLNSTCTWNTQTQRPISKDDNESDLFSWGYGEWSEKLYSPKSDAKSYVEGHDDPEKDGEQFSKIEDWGYAFGGESSVWRTLNADEWEYLFGKSTKRDGKYKCGVTVCGHPNCVVLLPDDWEWGGTVGDNWQTEYNEETTVKWSTMEEAGAVCLPAAGYSTGAYVKGVELYCAYWTSSGTSEVVYCEGDEEYYEGKDFAYYLWIANGKVYPRDFSERMQGNSVRLVTDVPAK